MKILVTGGSGLLGSHLLKLDSSLIAPARSEMDITDPETLERAFEQYKPETVLHLAAATKPPMHEKDPALGEIHNVKGTENVARAAAKIGARLVYTSSDYVYFGKGPHKEDEQTAAPSNFIRSKLGGEEKCKLAPSSLIIRLSFGPVPFPWDKVYRDQWNSKLYVDEMAPLILRIAQTKETGIMNVGGPRTTLEAYARRTRADIETIDRPGWVPEDTSLDISRMCSVLGISDPQTLLKHGI
jgi:dTDP-4-dehydrorhamnose reductase